MTTPTLPTVPFGSFSRHEWHTFFAVSAIAAGLVVFGVTLFVAVAVGNQPHVNAAETPVAHCDRLSRSFGERLASQGMDRSSADWRRETQLAFRDCMSDRTFGHLIAKP